MITYYQNGTDIKYLKNYGFIAMNVIIYYVAYYVAYPLFFVLVFYLPKMKLDRMCCKKNITINVKDEYIMDYT